MYHIVEEMADSCCFVNFLHCLKSINCFKKHKMKIAKENETTLEQDPMENLQLAELNAPVEMKTEVSSNSAKGRQWKENIDFLMTLIAYAIGLGNVWRFPYLCYKHGGAFLIPYFASWICLALPIFMAEVSLGQYLQQGSIGIWKLCPIFKGVGMASIYLSCICNIYYCVIAGWAIFYMFSSMNFSLPWLRCDHYWNNEHCRMAEVSNESFIINNATNVGYHETPAAQFWLNRVLQTSDGIDNFGIIQWELLLILTGIWIMTYFVLWKGITEARKVIYFCAIAPYILLIVLLIRGVTLSGASMGLKAFLTPNITKLTDITVWRDAGTQVFYSSGIGFGSLVAIGSHNNFNHNVYSMTAGIAVFSILGHLSMTLKVSLNDVVQSGVGLIFQVYPEAVSRLPIPQLWSVLFFLMIAILGIDSQICVVNGVIEGLNDQFPLLFLKKRKIILLFLCLTKFILGIPLVSQSGQYWLTLIDSCAVSGIPLLFVAFFEITSISWGFGKKKLKAIFKEMLGFEISKFWIVTWQYITPVWILALFINVVIFYSPVTYPNGRLYPEWASTLGILMSLSSMIFIPSYIIYYIFKAPGNSIKEKFLRGISRHSEQLTRHSTTADFRNLTMTI
ncbi:Sodium- and chloride-dependent GABA transporter 1 [Trichinella zimbabwensis]|uniref:Sodium-and chloride-dependent GABA transporter 1 n=1 Tax=Trichinella zimbabwensis TaxID=268475 RepID=A0A0V1H8V3_9BILA|nr:Sodium- and chloride-dependent GABA transporter 1 [Trichinella zimbabwensis]